MTLKEKTDFVKKLYNILDNIEYTRYITWSDDGKSFLILDPQEFSENVLTNFFRHKNVSSFIRQLNKYDFHKVKSTSAVLEKYGPQVLEFKNVYFEQGNRNQLYKIRRKSSCSEIKLGGDFPGVENSFVFQEHVITTIRGLSEKFESLTGHVKEIKTKLSDLMYDMYSKRINVLLFDEDVNLSMYIYSLLRDHNMSITVLDSQSSLYPVIKHTSFSFIVLSTTFDVANSVMGYFRSFDHVTPVIFIGYESPEMDVFSLGINDFIKKPFSHASFLSTIEKYIPKR
ncbi:Transcription factor prr1 [Nosema granulosis]|uniref:Transcription factor prr1 n=1 Tax=Nosema granulosis TaxID=83296 RepID=A0A9P6H283_9MICR|nr:Transcription factor prr1 [Nosema granulosis]